MESRAAGKRDAIEPTRTAYFRAAAATYVGGIDWQYCFVARGDVPAEMITLVNLDRRETSRKREINERTGVVNKVSLPKALPEEAKREATMLKAPEDAHQGRWINNWSNVEKLALLPTEAAGHPDRQAPQLAHVRCGKSSTPPTRPHTIIAWSALGTPDRGNGIRENGSHSNRPRDSAGRRISGGRVSRADASMGSGCGMVGATRQSLKRHRLAPSSRRTYTSYRARPKSRTARSTRSRTRRADECRTNALPDGTKYVRIVTLKCVRC